MPLINCKIHLELDWTKNCAMPNIAGATTFKTTSTKLYVPIATLSTKDNVNLTKQLNGGFKRSVYWNKYKSKIETQEADANNLKDFLLMLLFKELIDCLFLLLIMLTMMLIKLKETSTRNIFSQE